VLYIGRLIPDKGVADLIAAMRHFPHAELLVVGDGPDRARLEGLTNGTVTTFVGRVSHGAIADYLQQARVLVLPSYLGDGLPNVILEAMSWGVPVVATNTAGIPDIVRHGETGYLYEPGDVGKIVAYVGRLLADDELHYKLGVQSLEAVQSYSWSSVAPQIEQLLLECLETPQG
jgi:glycosyltransferase involved in cell wall biosynthesis